MTLASHIIFHTASAGIYIFIFIYTSLILYDARLALQNLMYFTTWNSVSLSIYTVYE
jgi:hypothetical protein